jgi:D-alanyl-D-alanine carboxypeptidase
MVQTMKQTSLYITVYITIAMTFAFFPGSKMNQSATPEKVLQKLTEDHKTPSVQYVIFNSDRILYSYTSGLADVANNKPANAQTTYHGFSVTKTFTALAVLQLAADEKLNIDDPVSTYLPGFIYGDQITIKNLLTHTSGIPNPIPLSWIHLTGDSETFDKTAFREKVIQKNSKTRFSPNEKFAYSNIGYMILGSLIEIVSGQPYEVYIREHILDKLHPGELDFRINQPTVHARGYHKRWSFSNALLGFFIDKSQFMDHPESRWKPFNHFYVNDPAYGGIIGSPTGFVAYLQELLKDESTLIADEYKQQLFTENVLSNGSPSGMCMSWFTGNLNGNRFFTHAGGGGGYYIELRLYPDIDTGSIIIFNRSGMRDERFLGKVDKYFIN